MFVARTVSYRDLVFEYGGLAQSRQRRCAGLAVAVAIKFRIAGARPKREVRSFELDSK